MCQTGTCASAWEADATRPGGSFVSNRLRELVALPPALESPCTLALSLRRGGACGLDRIGGRTELVRRDVCDDRRLAGGERGMAWRPTQILAAAIAWPPAERAAVMGDLAACPGPPEFDRATRSRVLRLSQLEEVQDMFRARCCPQGEEFVIRIGEGPTAADRHETRVAFLQTYQPSTFFCSHLPNRLMTATIVRSS